MNNCRYVRTAFEDQWKRLFRILALVALGFAGSPATLPADDVLLHPLCLDNLGPHPFAESGGPEVPLICDTYPEVEIEMGPEGWIRAERPTDPKGKTDGEPWYQGWIGYRVAGRFPQLWDDNMFYLLEVVSNTGGSGHFSTLWILEQLSTRQSQRPAFWPWLRIPGGDRCNDGELRARELSTDTLIYSHAATPFRLLNPTDRTNWRMQRFAPPREAPDDEEPPLFMNWQPYKDIPNGAMHCAGKVVKELDVDTGETRVTGVYVNPGQWSQGFGVDDPLKACTSEWVNDLPIPIGKEEKAYIPLDSWLEMREGLRHLCPDAEGLTKLEQDLDNWRARVQSGVQRRWTTPGRLHPSNHAVVLLDVDAEGSILDFTIESCSGRAEFCESVQHAVSRLPWIPPPPRADMRGEAVRILFAPD